MQDRNLLAHLAFNFAPHPENLAVEALSHILQRSSSSRVVLERFLIRLGTSIEGPLTFRTQVSDQDGTRPDLVGFDASGNERVFIEAKFWAGLTDQQPAAYLQRLAFKDDALLLFVAPDARVSTVWPDILLRASSSGFQCVGEETESDGATRTIAIEEQTTLAITSWATILQLMLAETEGLGQLEQAADIRQLLGLCQRMDDEAFQPLHSNDLGPDIPRTILQVNSLVGEAIQILVSQGNADLTGLRPAPRQEGFRHYAKILGAYLWLGSDYSYWNQLSETPLWLGTQNSAYSRFQELRHEFADLELVTPPRVHLVDESAVFPITLPLGREKDEVLDAVLKQVIDISSRFRLDEEQSSSQE